MRVLITGITGFVGSYMAELALAQGAEVYGACRWRSNTENIESIRARLQIIEADLRDQSSTQEMLATARPDLIFHLAGQSQVMTSWHAPAETLHTNIIGQTHLLEAIRLRGAPFPKVLVVGSSEEYGLVQESDLPVTEQHELRPLSPYAVSKVAQDMLAYQYHRSYGIPCIRVRAFNHDGPRRGEVFVTSTFARQIAEIELGLREPVILVGNLKARRDYTDVRDIVRGYWMLLERGEPGEVYNLCSGRSHAIQEVLDFFLSQSSVRNIEVREDPARLRPSDLPNLYGSAAKIESATGWKPTIPLEKTLMDVLNYWREKVKQARR
ncbi:MAG: SDR family oxidoreductase [Verrucomicrobia bacterium]|nr:MAG: SDR family oxidoreductase [Verrucomicrobiota bacterium]